MKIYTAPITAATMAIVGSTALAQQAPMTHPSTMAAGMHDAKADRATAVRMAMRKLWEDHITYTRGYIVSALADLPDTSAVATRLLKNQDDIGNAIKPYYGENAGEKLSALLRDHILIATEVVNAAKNGDKSGLKEAQQKWTDNGKDIAAFLSGANPDWSKRDLEEMLQKHLDLTAAEAVGRLNKDWTADIKAYDDGHVSC
ncbi:acetylglutamate kinase [Methylocystis rosea]|uniref:acetylglutamate kinase n=1 Tax=Methylocystis rosea TaxID=173366 RepID=UPI0018DC949F|nr:acetylglutamate kinase [Methylocystis rosea]